MKDRLKQDFVRGFEHLRILLLCLCLGLGACISPIPTTTPPPLTPTPVFEPDSISWQTITLGLEFRSFVPEANLFGTLSVLRIDPAHFDFRVHYRPGEALSVLQWRDALPDAVALVNANFFQSDYTINGLLVADSVVYGASYQGFGGLFEVRDGKSRLRSNALEPYLGEALEQAVQGFPMLVNSSQAAYTDTTGDRVTRRTIIAEDIQGRILLLTTPLVGMRLADLSALLADSDLQIVNALNLDGGGSTMMYLKAAQPYVLPSLDAVPAVLAVYVK